MSLTHRLPRFLTPRLALIAALLAVTLAASGCIGRGDVFAGPECDQPVPTVPPVTTVPPADTSADSTRADPPAPSPDLNPCSAPNV